ncbi:MAG: sigma 54-interacting transcriptional regulator [Methylococcaceae bacterium]|nr:sigma 54-interacting transcriptional regulator [Methylococcaceae bacterium]
MQKRNPTENITPVPTPEVQAENAHSRVWVLDTNRSSHRPLTKALGDLGIQAECFTSARDMLAQSSDARMLALVVDMSVADMDYRELMDRLQLRYPETPLIVITDSPGLEQAVSAFNEGAFEYLTRPFTPSEAISLIKRAQKQLSHASSSPPLLHDRSDMIGDSPAMHGVFRTIARLARSETHILIHGEPGSGKSTTAQAIHRYSPRGSRPLISLNIAAVPPELLESELFGCDGGMLPNGQGRRHGRLEQADNGTLFLHDISELPITLQNRMLRVLTEGECFPSGAHLPVRLNVRIIAATQRNLAIEVAEGRFREELYQRLSAVHLPLPALRDRREDIPLLLRHYLKESSRELKVDTKELHPDVEACLCDLDWPGNVRQLENTCRWITAMAVGKEVFMGDLPPDLLKNPTPMPRLAPEQWQDAFRTWAQSRMRQGESNIARDAIECAEAILIESALEVTRGRREEAAKMLGYGRNTVTRKISDMNRRSQKVVQ